MSVFNLGPVWPIMKADFAYAAWAEAFAIRGDWFRFKARSQAHRFRGAPVFRRVSRRKRVIVGDQLRFDEAMT